MFKKIAVTLLLSGIFSGFDLLAQTHDTITVQTLTFDSAGRNYTFSFPDLPSGSYEKILMQYRMRCKGAKISDGADRNKGCGEWDYSCNTFITDSSLTDSVQSTHPSHIISGFSGTAFNYRTNKSFDLIQHNHKVFNPGANSSETVHPVSTGNELINQISNQYKHNRMQVLYTAAELTSASFSAGNISGISFFAQQATGVAHNFKVRVKESTQTALSATSVDTVGFQEVFYSNITPVAGENKLIFFENFVWNGTTNLLLEFSYDLASGAALNFLGDANDTQTALVAQSAGNIEFFGSGWLDLSAMDFSSIKEKITVSFWLKGNPAFIPAYNTTLFEGVDANNQRQINAHMPWSDKNVYWDCGNDGTGYDRVNKQATAAEYVNNWKHWVLTKDAITGRMAIYRDGAIFTQQTNKKRNIDLSKLMLGSSFDQSVWFYGQMDGFHVWDTAVNQTLTPGIFKNDPAVMNGLQAHEKINVRNTVNGIVDISGNGTTILNKGMINIVPDFGAKLFRGFVTMPRPKLSLIRGQYPEGTVTTQTDYDTLFHSPNRIISYQIANNAPLAIDTVYGYSKSQGSVYDENGNTLSNISFSLDKTIEITTLSYYNNTPQRLELMSFVTPYGIGLDLGANGKMWEFDVSDFEPVLRGNKYLSMDFGGQYQEEMDIRFLFIKGTPARTPLSIQQIWKVDQRSYQDIVAQKAYEERFVPIAANTVSAKIRSVISGHGQEGEFIPQNHKLSINSGQENFSWQVWKGCADNPVFPQGGTWTFDRAGWCPGMPTNLVENDLTPYITAGQPVQVKYSISSPSGDSRYIANHQLVTYGAMNFANDVALVRVSKPSKDVEFEKFNPACSTPEVIIKNNGSATLTTVSFEYWVNPANKQSYQWTGSLESLEQTTVQLPISSLSFWDNVSAGILTVQVTSSDEYAHNNQIQSNFKMPKIHGNKLVLNYKTNLYPQENSYTVTDIAGNIVQSKGSFAPSKVYNDTLNLAEGCYKIEFLDNGDDGLSYWYWEQVGPSHGVGYLKLKDLITNATKTFPAEFGSRIVYEFSVSNTVGIGEVAVENQIHLYPNPTSQRKVNLFLGNTENHQIIVLDALGKKVENISLNSITDETVELDFGNNAGGIYYVQVTIDGKVSTHKVVLL